MIRAGLLAGLLAALPGTIWAQQTEDGTEDGGFSLTPELNLEGFTEEGVINEDGTLTLGEVEDVEQPEATAGDGAVLRGLDRVSGEVADLELATGETQRIGRLAVTLGECRFPAGNPSGDAYAYLVIRAEDEEVPVFEGWMIASSPALNALDHPRYDVWVLRCKTS